MDRVNKKSEINKSHVALRFAQAEYRGTVNGYNQQIIDRIEQERVAVQEKYEKANNLLNSKEYEGAFRLFRELGDYRDSQTKLGGIHFGDYTWRCLAVEGNRALLISQDIIEARAYQSKEKSITWEESDLRAYLNSDFYNGFTEKEKLKISEVNNINSNNPNYGTSGGNPTKDRVFLLSFDEAKKYFKDDKDRIAKFKGKTSCWWLRTPGRYSNCACDVYYGGSVSDGGYHVNNTSIGVRPALWLNL